MVNFSLEGKVALVTGAAYGIGFAMAQALAEAGAKIAFNCRTQANMDKAMEAYKAIGIDARGYICDCTDEAGVKAMVEDIARMQKLFRAELIILPLPILRRQLS